MRNLGAAPCFQEFQPKNVVTQIILYAFYLVNGYSIFYGYGFQETIDEYRSASRRSDKPPLCFVLDLIGFC